MKPISSTTYVQKEIPATRTTYFCVSCKKTITRAERKTIQSPLGRRGLCPGCFARVRVDSL